MIMKDINPMKKEYVIQLEELYWKYGGDIEVIRNDIVRYLINNNGKNEFEYNLLELINTVGVHIYQYYSKLHMNNRKNKEIWNMDDIIDEIEFYWEGYIETWVKGLDEDIDINNKFYYLLDRIDLLIKKVQTIIVKYNKFLICKTK